MRPLILALTLAPTLFAQIVPHCGLKDTRCQCQLDPVFCPRTLRTLPLTAMQVRIGAR